MKGYKTNTDYKRLKELLDKGYDVICVQKTFGIMLAKKKEGHYYLPYDMGIFPASEYNLKKKCAEYNLEYIEPTEV